MKTIKTGKLLWSHLTHDEPTNWLIYIENKDVYLVDDRTEYDGRHYLMSQITPDDPAWFCDIPEGIEQLMKDRRDMYG